MVKSIPIWKLLIGTDNLQNMDMDMDVDVSMDVSMDIKFL